MNIAVVDGVSFSGKNLAQMLYHQQDNKITGIGAAISFRENIAIPGYENIQFCNLIFSLGE